MAGKWWGSAGPFFADFGRRGEDLGCESLSVEGEEETVMIVSKEVVADAKDATGVSWVVEASLWRANDRSRKAVSGSCVRVMDPGEWSISKDVAGSVAESLEGGIVEQFCAHSIGVQSCQSFWDRLVRRGVCAGFTSRH